MRTSTKFSCSYMSLTCFLHGSMLRAIMAKTQEEKLKERLDRIELLQSTIRNAKAELMELTGITPKQRPEYAPLPDGFGLQETLITLLREKGQMSVKHLTESIFSDYGVRTDKKVVQSSLNNAVSGNFVQKIGKGRNNVFYKIPET